jgi:hypothetical protein
MRAARNLTRTLRIPRAKIHKKQSQNQPQRLGESACDPATLQSWNDLAIGPKIAKLASRQSECDERRFVIEMYRYLPYGPFGADVRVADHTPDGPGTGFLGHRSC